MLIAKTNQENSPHKPVCNDKQITGRKNVPTGKTGEAAILQREGGMLECHQVTPSREKRNKGEQGMHGGIIRQCIHRSLQPRVAAAALV